MKAPFALLLLVLFGRLKAKVGAWSPIPNRAPASLGASPQPGSSQVRIAEALLKNINQDEARWGGAHKAPPRVSGRNSTRSRGQIVERVSGSRCLHLCQQLSQTPVRMRQQEIQPHTEDFAES